VLAWCATVNAALVERIIVLPEDAIEMSLSTAARRRSSNSTTPFPLSSVPASWHQYDVFASAERWLLGRQRIRAA
jgi:hypothetical protein